MQGSLNAVLVCMVLQVVCTFTVVRAHRSHSHPQANANAGLKAPIFQMSDLVGTKGVFTVTPKNFTFGVTYNLGYSMPVADTVLSVHPLPACTTFAAHWHPYADETSIVIEGGPLNVGWMFVNSTYSASNISLGQVAVFPIGITHFLSNQNCWNSKYVVSFNSAQGGTIPVTHSVALMPQSLQEGFLGGDSYKIKDVKRLGLTYEDPECVKRCQRSQDGLA